MPTDYDIGAAFAAIEDELISSMMRNLRHHRAEETAEGFQWSQWQAEQLDALETYKRQSQKKYGKQFRSINHKLEKAIRAACAEGEMEQEEEILGAIREGFSARKMDDTLSGSFFKLNDRKLDALIRATTGDMEKAETAVLRRANDQYRKIIFNAQVYANTGAGTYEKAVDMATKEFLAAGLQCVVYRNGARHTLSDYADMALRTASKRAYLQGEGAKRQEWGISTVIISKRGGACPKCARFCGKVFIDDVWSGGKKSDGHYPLLSSAIAQGLYHPRCKDGHSTFFPDITKEVNPWTQEELDRLEQVEQEEQKHQHVKRQMEKFRRLAKYSLTPKNRKKYGQRASKWEKIYTDIELVDSEPVNELIPEKAGDSNILFVPSASAKEVAEFAQTKLGVKEVFFDKLDIKTTNALAEAVTDGMNYVSEIGEKMNFIGSSQQRNTKLRKELRKAFEKDLRVKYPGNTDQWYHSYAQKFAGKWVRPVKSNNLASAFNSIKEPNWPNAEAAYNRFTGIGVNERVGADYTIFSETIRRSVDSGYHPKGTDTVRAVFDHEIGHQIDYALGLQTDSDMLALYKSLSQKEIESGLSRYATKSVAEFIAEGYTEYKNNPSPRSIAKKIGAIIERAAKGAKP